MTPEENFFHRINATLSVLVVKKEAEFIAKHGKHPTIMLLNDTMEEDLHGLTTFRDMQVLFSPRVDIIELF